MLVVAAYLLPLLVGLGVTDDPSAWHLGYFTTLGQQVGGGGTVGGCTQDAPGKNCGSARSPNRQGPRSAGLRHRYCAVALAAPTHPPPPTTTYGYRCFALGLQVGGPWLAWWVVAAAAVSQIGQFEVCALVCWLAASRRACRQCL